jgi:hypothetical protein
MRLENVNDAPVLPPYPNVDWRVDWGKGVGDSFAKFLGFLKLAFK